MNPQRPQPGGDSSKLKIPMINFEMQQRQFLNELSMKRAQVEELKKELDAANLKIHETTRAADAANNTVADQKHNLSLAIANVRFLEDKLQTKRDSFMKTQLQQESALLERKDLRDLLQKAELQNYKLFKELNELKAQHQCDVAYQKELINKDNDIRAQIDKLIGVVQQFHIGENEIFQLMNKVEALDEMQRTVNFYQQELHKYKENHRELEHSLIVAKAAMETFQKLAAANTERFSVTEDRQTIMNQWIKAQEQFNTHTETQTAVIKQLTNTLNIEKETNTKICVHEADLEAKNEVLQKENEELRKTLQQFTKERQDVAIQTDEVKDRKCNFIKTEVIEIEDDNNY